MGSFTIKDELSKIQTDIDFLMEVEFKKAEYFINDFINQYEKQLIKIQETNPEREQIVQKYLNRMALIQQSFIKMDNQIIELNRLNNELKQKIEFFKNANQNNK